MPPTDDAATTAAKEAWAHKFFGNAKPEWPHLEPSDRHDLQEANHDLHQQLEDAHALAAQYKDDLATALDDIDTLSGIVRRLLNRYIPNFPKREWLYPYRARRPMSDAECVLLIKAIAPDDALHRLYLRDDLPQPGPTSEQECH